MSGPTFDPEYVALKLLEYAEKEWEWETFAAFEEEISIGEIFEVEGLGTVKVVDKNGYDFNKNYSGWSESLSIIFDVSGTLYKASGSYTSFVGSEWSETVVVVSAKEKLITYYE